MKLMTLIKLSNPMEKKPIPGIPIDVVAVNYAVFAIIIFINYYSETTGKFTLAMYFYLGQE